MSIFKLFSIVSRLLDLFSFIHNIIIKLCTYILVICHFWDYTKCGVVIACAWKRCRSLNILNLSSMIVETSTMGVTWMKLRLAFRVLCDKKVPPIKISFTEWWLYRFYYMRWSVHQLRTHLRWGCWNEFVDILRVKD